MSQRTLGPEVYKRAVIELGGYALSQLIRLISNLILTRLLFPEAFGIAALVSIFILGLVMLSDAGFEQSIVQNEDGESSTYLNTAWTMGIIRGFVLFLIACAISLPMSSLYGEPILAQLIPFAALSLILNGLASTSLYVARRRLDVLPLVQIELSAQISALIVVLVWVSYYPTVWALVFSGLVHSFIRMIASHRLTYGTRNQIHLDPIAARKIYDFGKWIFGSSALSFLSRQTDRLLIGGFVGPATLGIYSIAVFIGEAASTAVARITSGILFPVLSSVARDTPSSLGNTFYSARLKTDLLGLLPIGALTVVAPLVIQVLYDDRYLAAGWMLQLLCMKVALSILVETIQNCLFSMGQTKQGFIQNVIRSITLVVGIPAGWLIADLEGLILGVVLSEVPVCIYVWIVFYRTQLLRVTRELLSFAIYGIGLALGLIVEMMARMLFQ